MVVFTKQSLRPKGVIELVVFSIWCFLWTFQCAFGQGDDTLPSNSETWKLTAVAEPRPALTHSFWPTLDEFKRGNAVVNYQRAYMQLSAESVTQLREMLEGGKEFSGEQAKTLIANCATSWTEILRATYRKQIAYDLGLDQLTARQKLDIAIPEVEHAIALGNLVGLNVRLAIEEKRFSDAIEGIKAGFRCAAASREVSGSIFSDLVCLKLLEDANVENGYAHLVERMQKISSPVLSGLKAEALTCRQRLARLATIEALRDHVAINGQLPETLLEFIRLPAWPDPVTSEHFGYEKVGPRQATLTVGWAKNGSQGRETIGLKLAP